MSYINPQQINNSVSNTNNSVAINNSMLGGINTSNVSNLDQNTLNKEINNSFPGFKYSSIYLKDYLNDLQVINK